MKKEIIFPLIITLFLIGCSRPQKTHETLKHENVIAVRTTDAQSDNLRPKCFNDAKELVDVKIIRDTTPMGCYENDKNIEYVVGNNYIGLRSISGKDTIRQGYLICSFPPKVVDAIYEKGKDIIPFLINSIDIDDEGGVCGYHNPAYSDTPPGLWGPVGINYAYMIELIMSKDSIEHIEGISTIGDGWNEAMKPYMLYQHCTIVRKDAQGIPILKKLTMDDMRKIKKIYSDLWEENKGLDLNEMRKKWRNTNVWEYTPYMWI